MQEYDCVLKKTFIWGHRLPFSIASCWFDLFGGRKFNAEIWAYIYAFHVCAVHPKTICRPPFHFGLSEKKKKKENGKYSIAWPNLVLDIPEEQSRATELILILVWLSKVLLLNDEQPGIIIHLFISERNEYKEAQVNLSICGQRMPRQPQQQQRQVATDAWVSTIWSQS